MWKIEKKKTCSAAHFLALISIMLGGGAKSWIWPQIVSDVSNIPVLIPEPSEAASAGAAILAGVGSGVFESIGEASGKVTKIKLHVSPLAGNVEIYEDHYRKFLACLYHV